jgi:glutathione peroxidase
MTVRQQVLKLAYPLLMKLGRGKTFLENKIKALPIADFYQLEATAINGESLLFSRFKGKKVLLVNTASDCGYTAQYKELEQLYRELAAELVIIAFPANDFKNQEKEDEATIAAFCEKNYCPGFPLAKKTKVVKGPGQHPVYRWLTEAGKNGWNNQPPVWNFSKYLVNEEGVLTHFFGPSFSPVGKEVRKAIER